MSHQDRREPLPKGYQYGDARNVGVHPGDPRAVGAGQTGRTIAVDLRTGTITRDWNVIEGES